jgi:[protein-PII] uridylyltransferase
MATSSSSPELQAIPKRAARHLTLADDGIRFVDAPATADRPGVWLEAFRAAITNGRAVSHEVSGYIQEALGQLRSEDFTADEADRRLLLDLLTPRTGLSQRLSEMAGCGLLDRLFPELATIHRRSPADLYGRVGPGTHALAAVRRLESLRQPATTSRARFAALLEEIASPELLTLALLLHDPGTRRESIQSREAVRLAQPVLDRLELPASAVESVRFLIRYHRQMARVAFRRDAADPGVVARFAELVASEELLKMLCLQTLATLDAASADGLTAWKEDRLWRLYAEAGTCLALGPAEDTTGADEAVIAVAAAGRPDDISEAELNAFVSGLPRTYVAVFGVDRIYAHTRAARGLGADEVHAALESRGDAWELTLITADRPALFATVTVALACFGLDVHRARILRTDPGLALSIFEFTDAQAFLYQARGATRQLHATVEAALAGTVDPAALLRERAQEHYYPARRPSIGTVTVANDGADDATLVVVAADEGPSLLPRLGRVVGEAGCRVELALSSADRGQIVDVLHVTKEGRKLSEPDGQALQQELERILRTVDGW